MLLRDAYDIIGGMIAPVSVGEFFDDILGRRFVKIPGAPGDRRTTIMGADPRAILLQAFASLAPTITSHAAEPLGPPPASEAVADADAFFAKIQAFHERGYTVRFPNVRSIAPNVNLMVRALETVLHQPADAAVFWSRGDARAPVHHDEFDIIVIQLVGEKRWFISSEPSDLPNKWKTIPDGPPTLGPHQVVDVGPGDLLYLPRGTTHRVDAQAESVHVSIGFIPLTMREAIIAAVDHLSDLHRPFRQGVGNHMASAVLRNQFFDLPAGIRASLDQLQQACRSDDFIAGALQRRSSRVVGDLERLETRPNTAELTLDTVVQHAPLATFHIMSNERVLDFSYPGGHLYIHVGAMPSVAFIVNTPRFRVGDIAGEIDDQVRLSLCESFVGAGFLQTVAAEG